MKDEITEVNPTLPSPQVLDRMITLQEKDISLRTQQTENERIAINKGHEFNIKYLEKNTENDKLGMKCAVGLFVFMIIAVLVLIISGHSQDAKEIFLPIITGMSGLAAGGGIGYMYGKNK